MGEFDLRERWYVLPFEQPELLDQAVTRNVATCFTATNKRQGLETKAKPPRPTDLERRARHVNERPLAWRRPPSRSNAVPRSCDRPVRVTNLIKFAPKLR